MTRLETGTLRYLLKTGGSTVAGYVLDSTFTKFAGGVRRARRGCSVGASPTRPRRIVSLTLEYIKTNAHRMDYARYRREGLPITSAVVESLIKQFNQRVKGTEKFWIQDGAEAVLQIRAAYLSEDDRAERFHEQRPGGRAAGRNRQNSPHKRSCTRGNRI